jgi:hypothetical protein
MKCAVSQLNVMAIGAGTLFALGLGLAGPALAQDTPAEAAPATSPAPETAPAPSAPAEAAPAQSAPARAYPPPPPRYPNQAPPANYPSQTPPANYPSAPPGYQNPPTYWGPPSVGRNQWGYPAVEGIYRPFSFTIGVGPGALIGPGEHELALSYNLFRLGFGLARDLSFVISFEGTGTSSISPETGEDSWLKQENWLLGIQYHVVPRLYLRGSLGAGFVSEHTESASFAGGRGVAMAGAIGYEFIQTAHVALALDLNGSVTKYARESWKTAGLNLAVSFF